jgi:glycine C-acetyltransferase
MGALGGYVASTQAMREVLINKARPFLFSTSHPPSVVASCMAAISVLEDQPELIQQLWDNTAYLKQGLQALGYSIQSESPVLPVIVGSSEKATALSEGLLSQGIYVRAIVFPTVAKDKARVRVMVSAGHAKAHLEQALRAFKIIGQRLELI